PACLARCTAPRSTNGTGALAKARTRTRIWPGTDARPAPYGFRRSKCHRSQARCAEKAPRVGPEATSCPAGRSTKRQGGIREEKCHGDGKSRWEESTIEEGNRSRQASPHRCGQGGAQGRGSKRKRPEKGRRPVRGAR